MHRVRHVVRAFTVTTVLAALGLSFMLHSSLVATSAASGSIVVDGGHQHGDYDAG